MDDKAMRAVRYILDRIQVDPDLRYHMLGTESMRLLLEAEAESSGLDVEAVRAHRETDLQPAYRKRDARIVGLLAWTEYVRKRLDDNAIDYPPIP